MYFSDNQQDTLGRVELYHVEDGKYYFEIDVTIVPRYNNEVNQIPLFGTLSVDREVMIKEDSLSYNFSELPMSTKSWLKQQMRELIGKYIKDTIKDK